MVTFGTVDGTVYTDTDFLAANYANRVNQLIADIYDHIWNRASYIASGSNTIGTGSKTFTVTNNLSSTVPDLAPGTWVYIRPTIVVGNVKQYMQNWMLGKITSVTSTTIVVNVIITRGSGTFTSFNISMIGDIIQSLTSPYPLANGGTGTTTAALARAALGVPDQGAQAEVLFDDFAGNFAWDGLSRYRGEQFEFNLATSMNAYNASTNPLSGGVFMQNPQLFIDGDINAFNYDPTGSAPSVNTWSNHPGVVGMFAQNAGAGVFMLQSHTYFTNAESGFGSGASQFNNIQFPYANDFVEFMFMIPKGYGWSVANPGGFSIGFVHILTGYSTLFGVGSTDGLPKLFAAGYTGPYLPSGITMGAYVVTVDTSSGTYQTWVDASAQTTPYTIQEGIWYKVRISNNVCTISTSGTILSKTISGWTPPSMGTTKGSRICAQVGKGGGSANSGVLLDYFYYRHPVSR